MRLQLQRLFLFCVVLGGAGSGLAQTPSPPAIQPAASLSTSGDLNRHHPLSPTDFIQHLLALKPAEREKTLNEKMEQDRLFLKDRYQDRRDLSSAAREQAVNEKAQGYRKFWEAKVKEYEALSPADRESRLRMTQQTTRLRLHLKPLLRVPPANRAEKLAAIPADERPLVQERLKEWDQLPPQLQKHILENEAVMHDVARMESLPAGQRESALQSYSSDYRRRVEENLAHWHALPLEQRQQMYENFNRFFQLSEKEKDRTLDALSDAERQALEKSIHQFETLPAEQRKACIEAFRKFSNMTPEQRAEFLKNAERWQAMSSAERASWRNLSVQLPPLPPGLVMPPLPPMPPMPPLPPGLILAPSPGAIPPLPAMTNQAKP